MVLRFRSFCNNAVQADGVLGLLLVILLFLMPVGAATVKSWASTALILMTVVSGLVWWRTEGELVGRWKPVAIGMGGFFIAGMASFVNAENLAYSFSRLGKYYPLLLAVPLYVGFSRIKVDLARVFVYGLAVAAATNFCTALYSTQVMALPRAKGYYHPIIFGDLSMTIAALLVCSLLCMPFMKFERIGLGLAALGAVVAALLSETRGAWAAPPMMMLLLSAVFFHHLKRRAVLLVVAGGIVALLLLPTLFPDSVGKQLSRTQGSIERFVDGTHVNSSLGQRFLMWGIAVDVWKEHPWLGSGLGDFSKDAALQMREGKTDLNRAWMHAHSIFFEALATTGTIGFLSLVLGVFMVPFGLFVASWRKAQGPSGRFASLGGMALLTCFLGYGLSEAWLTRSAFVAVYAVFGAFFLALAFESRDQFLQVEEGTK